MHFKNYEMVHRDTPSTACANFAHTGDTLSKMQKETSDVQKELKGVEFDTL